MWMAHKRPVAAKGSAGQLTHWHVCVFAARGHSPRSATHHPGVGAAHQVWARMHYSPGALIPGRGGRTPGRRFAAPKSPV